MKQKLIDLLRASSIVQWVIVAAWLYVDRMAHDKAEGAVAIAASLLGIGVVLNLVVTRGGARLEPTSLYSRRPTFGEVGIALLFAALIAVALSVVTTPLEIYRTQAGAAWWPTTLRCLVHPCYLFAFALTPMLEMATRATRRGEASGVLSEQ